MGSFCRGRNLPSSQLFAWKKRLREAETGQFVAVEVAPAREVKLQVAARHSAAIEVRLEHGRSILVEPGFDASHLRALLSVLEGEA